MLVRPPLVATAVVVALVLLATIALSGCNDSNDSKYQEISEQACSFIAQVSSDAGEEFSDADYDECVEEKIAQCERIEERAQSTPGEAKEPSGC